MVGRKVYAYRVAYEAVHGPLSPDQTLHHECENAWCINPEHLTPMTQGQHLKEHGLSRR